MSDSASETAAVRRSSGAVGAIRSMRSYSRAIERGRLAAEIPPGRGERRPRAAFIRSGLAGSGALGERGVACRGGDRLRLGGDERRGNGAGGGGGRRAVGADDAGAAR